MLKHTKILILRPGSQRKYMIIYVMPNNDMQWSSATPGLLIIMIDQSGSMLLPIKNGSTSRTVAATRAVNRIINTIIEKNFDGRSPKNRCFISVIGYNHQVKSLAAGYLSDLDEKPMRVDKIKKKISDGAGGILEIEEDMPIWLDPIEKDGATNMKDAFVMAKDIIEQWINDKPNNPAPVVINISDGVPYFDALDISVCMQETIAIVDQIKAIDMADGKIQIFNAMIGDASATVFPTNKSQLVGEEANFLYEISTEIPVSYKKAAEKNGLPYQDGARGMICDADEVQLIGLIDFGSSKGLGDKH